MLQGKLKDSINFLNLHFFLKSVPGAQRVECLPKRWMGWGSESG